MNPDNNTNIQVSQKPKEIISFFDNQPSFVASHKKTEKLTSAVYMITNLFPETEPMRNILRNKISELLSYTIKFKDVGEGGKKDFIYNVKTRVLEVASFLEVSYRGGLVSEMNFSIINTEFHNLIGILENPQNISRVISDNSVKNIFEVTEKTVFAPVELAAASPVFQPKIITETAVGGGHYAPSPTPRDRQNFSSTHDSFRRTDRQNTILNLIKKKKEIMIKDITEIIKDCSEKTIQRELNTFIAMGVLKRSGVRRWSKYSLN